jgi:hypothetical protein
MGYINDFETDFIDMINDELETESLDREHFESVFDDCINDYLHQEIDNALIYYSDQIEVIKDLHLFDFSHLDNPQSLAQVCYMGIYDELINSGKIFEINNYNYKK